MLYEVYYIASLILVTQLIWKTYTYKIIEYVAPSKASIRDLE